MTNKRAVYRRKKSPDSCWFVFKILEQHKEHCGWPLIGFANRLNSLERRKEQVPDLAEKQRTIYRLLIDTEVTEAIVDYLPCWLSVHEEVVSLQIPSFWKLENQMISAIAERVTTANLLRWNHFWKLKFRIYVILLSGLLSNCSANGNPVKLKRC